MTHRLMDITIYAEHHQYLDALWEVTVRTRSGHTAGRTDGASAIVRSTNLWSGDTNETNIICEILVSK